MPNSTLETELVKLENVCHLITDGKHGDCEPDENSGYYFLSAKDVRDGKLVYENSRQITKEDFLDTHRRTKLEPLDILIVSTGATIGRMAMASDNEFTARTTFQKSVAILKPNKELVSPHWLYYKLLQSKDLLVNMSGGTAQGNLLLRDLRAFQVKVPPLPTQRRIADILSAYDDLIENNTRRLRILEQMAQAIYQEWFGKVDKESLPKGWELKKLGDVIELAYGKGLKADQRIDGDYPVYGSAGVVGYHNEYLVKSPGIIVGRKGNVGSVFWSNKNFFPIDTTYFVQTNISLYYAFFNLQTQHFINNDAAVPGLNRNQAYSLPFLVPSKTALDKFDNFIAPIFQQLENLNAKNANLRQTRDLLLPRLVSGEIAV